MKGCNSNFNYTRDLLRVIGDPLLSYSEALGAPTRPQLSLRPPTPPPPAVCSSTCSRAEEAEDEEQGGGLSSLPGAEDLAVDALSQVLGSAAHTQQKGVELNMS